MKIVSILCTAMFLCLIGGCNPTKSAYLTVDENQCIGCAKCINVCIADAVRIISNKAVIDPTKCTKCGNCVEICPVNAVY